MRIIILLASCAVLAAVAPLSAQGVFGGVPGGSGSPFAGQVDGRIWVEDARDYVRAGDRLNVRFSVSDDAYVAIIHVDTDGNLDFVYPASPWDNEYVRGGRVYTLPVRGAPGGWPVRGRSGIGYFYLVASPYPLDFSHFHGFGSSPWDWGYAGRAVRGDPFFAFHQITQLIVPAWPRAPYVYDYYGYHVGGLHRYPSYACSSQRFGAGWGWTPAYGPCDRLDLFLRQQPYYYDTRRFGGDRQIYFRDYERLDPRHGFKEEPDRPARGVTPRGADPRDGVAPQRPRPDELPRRDPLQWMPESDSRPEAPPARRPTLERRPPESSDTPPARAAPERSRPEAEPRPAPRAAPVAAPRPAAGGGDSRPAPRAAPAAAPRPAASGGDSRPAPRAAPERRAAPRDGDSGSATPQRRARPEES